MQLAITLCLVLASHTIMGARRMNIFGHIVEEDGTIHSDQFVSLGPADPRFEEIGTRGDEAVQHWQEYNDRRAQTAETRREILDVEGRILRLETGIVKVEAQLSKLMAGEIPPTDARIARLKKVVADRFIEKHAEMKRLEELRKPDPMLSLLKERSAIMVSRDHVVTRATWGKHLEFARMAAGEITISEDQARDLSDNIINGPHNLLAMRTYWNFNVKGLLESDPRYVEHLEEVVDGTYESHIGSAPSAFLLDKPISDVQKKIEKYMRIDQDMQSIIKLFDSADFDLRRDRVFDLYQEWMTHVGFMPRQIDLFLRDLKQRVEDFEADLKQKAQRYHSAVKCLLSYQNGLNPRGPRPGECPSRQRSLEIATSQFRNIFLINDEIDELRVTA